MIGYAITKEQAKQVTDVVALAQTSRGMPVAWMLVPSHIFTGYHAGLKFIECDENLFSFPIIGGNPPLTPVDFPEFAEIVAALGGLDARVTINPQDLVDPDAPNEP